MMNDAAMLRLVIVMSVALVGCGEECVDDGSGWRQICRDGSYCYFRIGDGLHYDCKSCDDCRTAADGIAETWGNVFKPPPPAWQDPPGTYDTFETGSYALWNWRQDGPDDCALGLPASTLNSLYVYNDHQGGISIGLTGVPGFSDRNLASFGGGRMSDPTHGMTSVTVSDTPGFDSACSFVLHREVQVTVRGSHLLDIKLKHQQSQASGRCAIHDCTSSYLVTLY